MAKIGKNRQDSQETPPKLARSQRSRKQTVHGDSSPSLLEVGGVWYRGEGKVIRGSVILNQETRQSYPLSEASNLAFDLAALPLPFRKRSVARFISRYGLLTNPDEGHEPVSLWEATIEELNKTFAILASSSGRGGAGEFEVGQADEADDPEQAGEQDQATARCLMWQLPVTCNADPSPTTKEELIQYYERVTHFNGPHDHEGIHAPLSGRGFFWISHRLNQGLQRMQLSMEANASDLEGYRQSLASSGLAHKGQWQLVVKPQDLIALAYFQVFTMLQEEWVLRQCPFCGRYFRPASKLSVYCTPACANRARIRRYGEKRRKATKSAGKL